jgi:RecA-family ATPase
MTDEKELRDVIKHIAHEGESTWIFGYAKHGKTWIMLCIVKALLSGEPLFNVTDLEVPRQAKRVIYLCPEATRTSLRFRLKMLGLMDHLYDPITNPNGRLYLRSLSKGVKLGLDNSELLKLGKGADIFIDTAIRYLEGEENSSSDVKVMTEQVLNLLAMGARSMWVAHHSGKAFSSATEITLENCARGSSEFAAALTNAIGVVQLDKDKNLIHFHFIDGRDMEEPVKDMHLQGRPHLFDRGNFQVTENVERFKGRNSKSGPKDDPERQAKIEFAKNVDGSLQEKADALNERFGTKHSKSFVHGLLKEFDQDKEVT